jgi:phosphohistidine phosphatase
MELYFMRHGAADKRSEWQGDDGLRRLTEEGAAQVRRAARALVAAGLSVDAVVTSPLVRARQTADIAAEELGFGDAVREDERLAGGLNRQVLARLLADLGNPERVLLVGHEPDFSMTIGQLTGGSVICKKGGIARVDLADPATLDGQLVWLAPPRLLGGHDGG